MMGMKNRFTLIELLVVIAIIGILASMLLPSLSNARKAAQASLCVSNQKQIAIGMFSYVDTYDGMLPYSLNIPADQVPNANTPPAGGSPTMEKIYVETGESIDVFTCPLDPSPEDFTFWFSSSARQYFVDENARASYMFNEKAAWAYAKKTTSTTQARLSQISNPVEWPYSSDGIVSVHGGNPYWRRVNPANSDTGVWKVIDYWHNNSRVAMLFGDGHVENIYAPGSEQYEATIQ